LFQIFLFILCKDYLKAKPCKLLHVIILCIVNTNLNYDHKNSVKDLIESLKNYLILVGHNSFSLENKIKAFKAL